MEKRDYYRLLGLTEEAGSAEIHRAYEEKVKKLKSSDYADDPEYVQRKLAQVKEAYRVLTGSAAPTSRAQKEARFERLKDALDAGEDGIAELKRALNLKGGGGDGESLQEKFSGLAEKLRLGGEDEAARTDRSDADRYEEAEDSWEREADTDTDVDDERRERVGGRRLHGARTGEGAQEAKRILYTYSGNFNENLSKRGVNKAVGQKIAGIVIVICLAVCAIGACVASLPSVDFDFSQDSDNDYVDTPTQVERIFSISNRYDYAGHLDDTHQQEYLEQVAHAPDEVTEDMVVDQMSALAEALHIDSYVDAINYLVDDEDYFWETSDADCMMLLTSMMMAPIYEAVAGMTDLYSGEPILSYSDYFDFLIHVAEQQTDALLEEYE